ncbi:MAG: glycosyltransferase family 2 protein [Bacteroidales bacterium]|nr:glycosyltransferase family 2 protein [Bacteroidales bacterium]
MKIATIILNYNSSADCKKCIGDLLMQENVEQEIIVVDNCSKEEERLAVENLCNELSVTFIANDKNCGYNAGNNIGLRYAAEKGYGYALIANPDMQFPNRDYLQKLLEPMFNDKEIVVCGSDIVTPEGVHQNPKKRGEDKLANYFFWIKEFFKTRKSDTPEWIEEPTISKECRCLNGCCFLTSIDFIKQIGFLDEGTFLYGEEPILGIQVERTGSKMYYLADTYAIHNHKKSNEGSSAFCLKHWRHSMVHRLYKYSNMPLYKKVVAQMGIELYFLTLKLSHWARLLK